jgi:hypothetical protein
MRILSPDDFGYDTARAIANARFDYKPQTINYCCDQNDVIKVVREAQRLKRPVRIRSGGHQHEGMCSGDGVMMIDVSSMNAIEFASHDPGLVWVGAGARLKDIYTTLWKEGCLFSGGGCSDVHIGGLAQGGGWGPISRMYGMTCDRLVAADLITATGEHVRASVDRPGPLHDLLWGLRGGGGGNFGVVTNYLFRALPWKGEYCDFLLTWCDEDFKPNVPNLEQFVLHWIQTFPLKTPDRLTTFLRLSVVDSPTGARAVVGGRFLGSEDETKAVLAQFLAGQAHWSGEQWNPSPKRETIPESRSVDAAQWDAVGKRLASLPGYQPGPALMGEGFSATGRLGDPAPNLSDTCAGVPLRHKISSGFAEPSFDLTAIQLVLRVLRTTPYKPEARQYLSFHSLGGAVGTEPEGGAAFAFRDRRFLLQYQAWWMPKESGLDGTCIKWIEDFRRAMTDARYTSGAFINFIDADIPLEEYYGKVNYQQLRKLKKYWDGEDFFKFGMSIPPA